MRKQKKEAISNANLHVCPMCFGGGKMLVHEYDDPETNLAVGEYEWCTYCSGTGRIPSEKVPADRDESFKGVALPEDIMKIIEEL
ncbi:hypothetical protein [Sediminibacillus halophilus]|uniref:Uncharacterized protein n=1 Tax=Sediminibacillus halophilus TaxID=482461 RepID=A0A1G9WC03_9BACI|nr:hypothetical protein [Sediminibacillus halophilus]SDM81555.1 hypothetical protein SAMN05216244_3494 [Sediminibacillus halophilus]